MGTRRRPRLERELIQKHFGVGAGAAGGASIPLTTLERDGELLFVFPDSDRH